MQWEDLILVSVDDHVVEPPHVFEGRLPKKYQDRAPRLITNDDGSQIWTFEDEVVTYIGLNAVAGRPPEEYGVDPTSYSGMREGCYDIHERILDMNANGVLASLNFPTFPQFAGQLFSRQKDKDLSIAVIQAYNDWHIDDWAGTYPGRIIPCCLIPFWDTELAAAEVRRISEKGCHAVTFSENPYKLGYPSLHGGEWDPFFAACAEVGTVVCTHLGSSSSLPETSPDAPMDVSMVLSPANLMALATDILFSGIFNKFPTLKVALSEGGIGWIPYFLERSDYVYRHHHAWTGTDFGGRLPSEVFRDHMITCFIDDEVGVAMRDRIGIETICWECDYPHSDSTWPKSPERVLEYMSALSDEELRMVTHENALRHFQFDAFSHVPREQAAAGALRATVPDRNLVISDGRRPVLTVGNPTGHQYHKVDA
jgi:predicted TIM-barrel fold metal-dependent hydrolase